VRIAICSGAVSSTVWAAAVMLRWLVKSLRWKKSGWPGFRAAVIFWSSSLGWRLDRHRARER